MRIANPMPSGTSVTMGYDKFKLLVEERSHGRIVIKPYHDAVLGNDLDTMQEVQSGELEMASSSTPNMAEISEKLLPFDLPYLMKPEKQEQLYRALDDGELGRYLESISKEVGLKPLMWCDYGYQNFATVRKEVHLPDDVKGLRMSITQSPVDFEVTKSLGALPASLVWTDTYPALLRGKLDGESNTYSTILASQHNEVIRYISSTKHNYSMHVLMMNFDYWNNLPSDLKEILGSSAREALNYQRALSRQLEANAKREMQELGVTVTELSEEEMEVWRKALQPIVDKLKTQVTPELLRLIEQTQQ